MAMSRPLIVAGLATLLLIGSLTVDLAYGQDVTLQVKDKGEWRTIGTGSLDSDTSYAKRPTPIDEPLSAGHNDTLEFRILLANGYPWPSSHTFTVTTDGCYLGATELASVRVSASGSATGDGTTQIRVKDLSSSGSREPVTKEVGTTGNATPTHDFAYLNLCIGPRYVTQGTLVFAGGTL